MATSKFKEPSPYTKPRPSPPPEDYLYKLFENDIALKGSSPDVQPMKVAMFGIGRAGMIHLANIAKSNRVELLYIVDNVEENWTKMKNHFHLKNVTFLNDKQSDRVFKDPKVDAVVIASPTFTHEEIVIKALNAKKSVFCEKPIAENYQNTAKCFEIARQKGKPLFTAFNRRFDPSYNAVRNRVRKGEVGHVHVMKIVSRDSPPPSMDYIKISGGIFHDCMVHDIDMMTWVLGEYPTKVSVQCHANFSEMAQMNDCDTVVATLKFPSGTLGMIDLSRNACYGYDMRLEVFGPKGMVKANNEQPIHCVETTYNYNGINTPPIWYSFASRFKLAYYYELEHFLDVITGQSDCSIKEKEILAVSKIAAACEQSAHSGQMVEINWAPGELPSL